MSDFKYYNLKIIYYPNGEIKAVTYDNPILYGEYFETEKIKNDIVFDVVEKTDIEKEEHSLNTSRTRTINNLINLVRSNKWNYFVTFTFDNEKVDRYDYDSVSKKIKNWIDYTRRNNNDFKYVIVPELHKDGAYHFHGLMSDVDLKLLPAINQKTGQKLYADKRQIYNCSIYKLGFSTVTLVGDSARAGQYICKYITKDLCAATKNKKRYWSSRNLEKPIIKVLNITDNVKKEMYLKEIEKSTTYKKVVHVKNENYINTITYFELN